MVGLDDRVLMDILERAVGPDRASTAFDAFSLPPSVSIRYNPFKIPFDHFCPEGSGHSDASLRSAPPLASLRSAPVPPLVPRVALSSSATASRTEESEISGAAAGLRPYSAAAKRGWTRPGTDGCPEPAGPDSRMVPWNPYGVMLEERPRFVMDPLFHAGCYYVQDSSAMIVGHMVREFLNRFDGLGRPVRVLDLCAAPGGKTTDLAASLRERFGDGFLLVANEVMRNRASILCDNVAVWGDPNVVVTSCDPKAFERLEGFFDIVVTDVPCSGEGMFRKDPKAVEDWSPEVVSLCSARQKRILADVWPSLRQGGLLVYSTCTFEEAENDANVGWAASELGAEVLEYGSSSLPGVIPTRAGGLLVPGFVQGEGQFVSVLEKTAPAGQVRQGIEILRPLRNGLEKGTVKGKDLVPSADWALSIFPPTDIYPAVDLDLGMALKFLHRDGIFIEGQPEGYLIVRFEGHPLGFVKNIGKRWNSLHPQNRRIRIDV